MKVIRLCTTGDIYQQLATELNISYDAARIMLHGILYGQVFSSVKLIVDGAELGIKKTATGAGGGG